MDNQMLAIVAGILLVVVGACAVVAVVASILGPILGVG